ncbi:MAG: RNA polymerase factor sigma-32 [Polyangiaceae bacterium]
MATRRKVTPKSGATASNESPRPPTAEARDTEEQSTASEASSDESSRDDDDVETIDAPAEIVDEDVGEAAIEVAEKANESSAALGKHDPLQIYLREVQRHALLTPEEEHTLAVKYATTQDVQAAARMVTANLRLVVKIAYEYRRAYKNIMDLIQEGNIGLMQAVKKFDPNRGVKLSSYSAWWIRAYILRFIINNWRLVKLGTTQAQRKLFFNLNKEKARLSAMGIDPTPAEIAQRLGVEESEAMEMDRRLSSGEMSLDAPIGDNEGRPVSRIELMPSGGIGPDSLVADEQVRLILNEKLDNFRKTLKGKDIDIFDRRLVAEEPLTLQELGDQFGISRERVRQLEARLTTNLKNYLKAELGEAV